MACGRNGTSAAELSGMATGRRLAGWDAGLARALSRIARFRDRHPLGWAVALATGAATVWLGGLLGSVPTYNRLHVLASAAGT